LLNIASPAVFEIFWDLSVLRSGVWPFGVTWRHRSRDHSIPHEPFPWSDWNNQRFPRYSMAMWRNGWHDLKRPLNKGQGHSFWYQSTSHMRLPI